MTMQSRLHRVTQTLSPLQRAVVVLQAVREGREPDPALQRIDDPLQRRAFNRYMALLWVANQHLGAIAGITTYRVELAEDAAHYHELFNSAAGLIEEREGLEPARGDRNWRQKPEVSVPLFLRSLALEARDNAVANVEHLWKETLALEAVAADLAEEFAGEDILMPEFRQRMQDSRERLKQSAKKVGLRKLPAAPDDATMRLYRASVEESFRHLGYAED